MVELHCGVYRTNIRNSLTFHNNYGFTDLAGQGDSTTAQRKSVSSAHYVVLDSLRLTVAQI
jgi:hypothetical protein